MSMYKEILETSKQKFTKQHFYGRFYSRISIPFTIALIKLRFSPNFITSISLLLSLISSIAYVKYSIITAIVLFELGVILDYSDGAVAVYIKKASKFGAWFDHIGDRVVLRLIIIGICIGVFLKYNSPLILILGFIMLAIKTLRDYNEVYVNMASDYKDTTQAAKNTLKNKFGFLSTTAEFILDLQFFALPFIPLFNLTTIISFFSIYIATELARIIFDLICTGKKFY